MGGRRRIAILMGILISSNLVITVIVVAVLYRAEISGTRERLRVTVQSQARLIESVARYDAATEPALKNERPDFNPSEATLSQIVAAHENYSGFGKTGEFTMARRDDDSMVFLLRHRMAAVDRPTSIPIDSDLAEPMRRALGGQSGTVIGTDYRGSTVVAAYEPVAVLDYGLVAKIDLAEVRFGFLPAAMYAFFATLLLTALGTLLFRRVSEPVIEKLASHSAELQDQLRLIRLGQEDLKVWEMVFKNAGWGLLIVDAHSHQIVSANPSFAEMHGYTLEEAQTMNLSDMFCEEERPLLPARSREVHETGGLVYESIHVRKNGTRFPVLTSARAIYDDRGNVRYRAINFQDISENKRSERIVHALTSDFNEVEGRAFFKVVSRYLSRILSLNCVYVAVRVDEKIDTVQVAGGWCKGKSMDLSEYSLEGTPCEVVFRDSFCFFPAGVREQFPRDEFLRENNIEGYIGIRMQNRNSEPIGILVGTNDVPIQDQDGVLHIFRAFSRRIVAEVERSRFRTALYESESLYRAIVEDMSIIVCRFDPDGKILFANEAAQTCFDSASSTLIGKQAIGYVKRSRRKEIVTKIRSLTVDTPVVSFDIDSDKSGYARWYSWSVRAMFHADGELSAFQSIGLDMTQTKQDHESRLLLERKIQHTQKLESLGVLAGGIAHDFNNLLMTILGNADIALQDLSPNAPARSYVETIARTGHQAADLASQMLAYSGKGQFVIDQIELNVLIEEMIHLLQVTISKKAILKTNYTRNLPTMEGDASQIRQVIMNLIINASEAIGDRSGVISLSTGAAECDREYLSQIENRATTATGDETPEGLYVYFEVADTGCGMDEETRARMFDPFFTTKFTGRGLGMAAMLGIVRGHRGLIRVYSEVNEGTTIKVLFPASELTPSVRDDVQDEVRISDWQGHGTVLIADDDESVLAISKQFLERLGFDVLTARDGQEAIDVFQHHASEITCVLLDMTMPHVDGKEAFREIHRLDPRSVVILCSGYSEQDATQYFVGKGLSGFLQKPYQLADLKEKLIDVLS